MNLYDELRLAHEHVKNALSGSSVGLIQPYRSLLESCDFSLRAIRTAYGLPSPLPREDSDLLKGFGFDLSDGVSSTDIDF